jgi:hypothetical protein
MAELASRHRILALLVLTAAAGGCGSDGDAPADSTGAAAVRPAASAQAREASGLSHLPRPQSFATLQRSLARHYPRELAGVRPTTSVLVDVTLDARGNVKDVAVVDRPAAPASNVVLIDRAPGSNVEVQREAPPTVYDNAFGPAAAAALKEVRFLPALRDGQPVPFTLRMSVEFTAPAS